MRTWAMPSQELLGRAPELAVLTHAVDATAQGAGGVVVLDGPAGIGKSRLAGEAARLAGRRRFIVAEARSDELDQVTPLGPLISALRGSDPPIITGGRPLVAGLADQRLWLLERLRAVLEAAAARRPILVSIDDLQWADEATLQALATLPGQLFSVPILWVLARRSTPASPRLHALLGRLAGLGAHRLEVGPIPGDAIRQLATDTLGAPPDAAFARLLAQAHGNPFYATELLGALTNAGQVVIEGAEAKLQSSAIPAPFHASVAAHIRALSAVGQQIVQVASVLGADFAVADLATLIGQASGRLLVPLTEILDAGLFTGSGNALAFRHDLIRQAVYDELPPPLRQALHRDAARTLARSGAAVSGLVEHLARSARPGDEEALELLEQAAVALAPSNPTAAADAASLVLTLLPVGDPRRPQTAATAVDLLGLAGRLELALRIADAMAGDHQLSASQEATIELGIRRSWVMTSRSPIERHLAPRLLEEPSVPAELRAMLLSLEAAAASHSNLDEAIRLNDAARRDAALSGVPDALTLATAVQAGILYAGGQLVGALACAEEAHQLRPSEPASYPDWFVGFCLCPLDRLDEALYHFAQASRDAEQMGSPFSASIADASRGAALLGAGRLDDAAVAAQNAIETSQLLGLGQPLGEGLRVLAEVQIRQGDLGAAKATVGQLRPLLAARQATATASWALALLADAQGDPVRAVVELAEPIELLARGTYRLGVPDPPQLAELAALALRAGERQTALAAAAAAEYLADTNSDITSLAGVADHARALFEHDPELLRQAVTRLERGQRPLAVAAAQEHLAAMLGDEHRDEAISLLDAAHDRYARAGADRDADRARSALRRLGIRRRPLRETRPASGWGSLTPAETAVTRAIAEGLTTRQAADQLFLSVHTVNTHLRHAFRKLNIGSRAELVRLVLTRD